jgi:phage RecT family recombinase
MSTTAVTVLAPSRTDLIPAPAGLPKHIAEAYDRAMGEVVNLIDSPDVQSRFAHVMLTQLRTNRALQDCSPASIILGIVAMAEHGLDPSAQNECWLIPYKGVAQMQTGYGGLLKLALSHPDVLDVYADEVCANDVYEFYGVNAKPKHVYPGAFQPRGRYIGYYAVAALSQQRWRAVQMSVEETKAHAKFYSNNWDKKIYGEDAGGGFRGMSLKTVLRKICNTKYLPMTGKVASFLHSMDTFEGVVDAEVQDIRDVARHQLEAGKSATDHIEDLTGQRPLSLVHGTPAARSPVATPASSALGAAMQSPAGQAITALLQAKDIPHAEQEALWEQWQDTYPDLTPGALTRIREQMEKSPVGKEAGMSTLPQEVPDILDSEMRVAMIDVLLKEQGLTTQQRTAWKGTMTRKHRVKAFRDIPREALQDLLTAMQAKAFKRKEAGHEATSEGQPPTPGSDLAPVSPAATTDDDDNPPSVPEDIQPQDADEISPFDDGGLSTRASTLAFGAEDATLRTDLLAVSRGLIHHWLREEIEELVETADTPLALLRQKFDEVSQQLDAEAEEQKLPF